MARNFFNPESGVWRPFGWLGDLIILSGLWLLCSVPLVTAGGATAALYDAVVRGFRRKENGYLSRFFETFKHEWKRGIPSAILWELLLAAAFAGVAALSRSLSGGTYFVLVAAADVLLILLMGAFCWVFPLLSRFTLDFRTLNGNALRLALAHLPATFVLGLMSAAALWLTVRLGLWPVMFAPALLALGCSLLLEPVFQAYEK